MKEHLRVVTQGRFCILPLIVDDELTRTFPEVVTVYLHGVDRLLLDDASNVKQLVLLVHRDM
jgi:hypothetical protein